MSPPFRARGVFQKCAVPISVFITVGGGVYFLYLLLSNRRV